MKLAGKIALITGGSRGIGHATALAFAAEGADIAFCHLDDGAKADQTAGKIKAHVAAAMSHRSALDVARRQRPARILSLKWRAISVRSTFCSTTPG